MVITVRNMGSQRKYNRKISVCERKILRKIYGPTKEANGIWRIKTNKQLDELIKHRNIINYIKTQRLSWFGHINRTPVTCIVKRIHKWKSLTGRPAGRPKSRWEDDVRNDLKKMKLVKWAEQIHNTVLQPAIRIPPQPATPKRQHTSKQEHTTSVVTQ